jgi:hypothetical protein
MRMQRHRPDAVRLAGDEFVRPGAQGIARRWGLAHVPRQSELQHERPTKPQGGRRPRKERSGMNRTVQDLVRKIDQKKFKNYSISATESFITILDDDSLKSFLPHDEISMTPNDLIEFCKFILDANDKVEFSERSKASER